MDLTIDLGNGTVQVSGDRERVEGERSVQDEANDASGEKRVITITDVLPANIRWGQSTPALKRRASDAAEAEAPAPAKPEKPAK